MTDAAATPSTGTAVRHALLWNIANFGVNHGASAIFFFILARQLPPEVFGLFALAIVFVEVFTVQGKSAAVDVLIQRQDFSARATSTIFFMATAVALLAVAATMGASTALAQAFKAPKLAELLPCLALTILAAPWIAVMEAIVMRDLKFKALSLRNMAAVIVGGVVGLAVAFSPASIWALVAQRLAQTAVSVAFLVGYTRWTPRLEFASAEARVYMRSIAPLWASQGVAASGLRLVDLIIGLRLGAATLGHMRVASKFVEIVHSTLTSAIFNLWVPLMSRVAGDQAERASLFLRLISFASMICIPPMIGLALCGHEIAALFLAPVYAPVGSILQFIGVGGLFIPISFFRTGVFAAMGRNGLSLGLAIFEVCLAALVAYVASGYGLTAMLAASLAVYFLTTAVSGFATARVVGVSGSSFVAAVAPAYAAVAAMAVAVIALDAVLPAWPAAVLVAAKVVVGGLVFTGWLAVFHREWLKANIALVRRDA